MIRTFIEEFDGFPGKRVNYYVTQDNGDTQLFTCSKYEWEAEELKDKLSSISIKWNPEEGIKVLDQYLEKVSGIIREEEYKLRS